MVLGLMSVDDLALLADTPENLQAALDMLHMYCEKWSLTVHEENKGSNIWSGRTKNSVIWFYNGNV